MAKLLTANEARARIRLRGITLTKWASDHGYSRDDVYRVLGGQLKAHFGRAHEIAVALGMKPSTSDSHGNTQSQKAA